MSPLPLSRKHGLPLLLLLPGLLGLIGMGCSSTHDLIPSNVDSVLYSHNLSVHSIPATYSHTIEPSKYDPTRHIYTVMEDVIHEDALIIPRGSLFSAVAYYRNTPHLAVDMVQIEGQSEWTPAQGVLSKKSETLAFVTLSHIAVPIVKK